MRPLPTPATVVEEYLAAIHEELRALRVAFVDGLPGLVAGHVAAALGQPATPPAPSGVPKQPTKRTRTRTRGDGDDQP